MRKKLGSLILGLSFSIALVSQVRAADKNFSATNPNDLSTTGTCNCNYKHWFVGVGPAVSNSLGVKAGTKYNIKMGYALPLSEHQELTWYIDGNFNSATQGSTQVSTSGIGYFYFMKDRGADTSLFVNADVGYGGGNSGDGSTRNGRGYDASATLGTTIGMQFYRTKEATFEVAYERLNLLNANPTNINDYPYIEQIRFGIYF